MFLEERKIKHQRITEEIWNNGNVAAMDEEFAPTVISHMSDVGDLDGLQAYRQHILDTRTMFPDFHVTIDELIGEGDTLAERWTMRGTYMGPLKGIPVAPTGMQATAIGTWVGHFVDGKIVEDWATYDALDWQTQLGILPAMESSDTDTKV